jgi:hypothetical protein
MYEIMNNSKRSYVVGKDDVISGGIARIYPAGPTTRHEVELPPGNKIYKVTDECGKLLLTHQGIFVLRINGKEVPQEDKTELSVEEKIARLTAQIEDLKSAKKKAKKKSIVKKAKEPVTV